MTEPSAGQPGSNIGAGGSGGEAKGSDSTGGNGGRGGRIIDPSTQSFGRIISAQEMTRLKDKSVLSQSPDLTGDPLADNAVGGNGILVFRYRIPDREAQPSPTAPQHTPELDANGKFFGAGGGGYPDLGDGAIGGDGGDGGNVVLGSIYLEAGEYQVIVGKGGRPGKDGSDTTLYRKLPDGRFQEVVSAKAGASTPSEGRSRRYRHIISTLRSSTALFLLL